MLSTTVKDPHQLVKKLIHDLRQPLGNIENSTYYLNLLLASASPQVREQLLAIEHQIEQAASLLSEAAAELYPARDVEHERKSLAAVAVG